MSLDNLYRILQGMNIPVRYSRFKEVQKPPFITYKVDSSDNFCADNKVYDKVQKVLIELYTYNKDTTKEQELETILTNNEIPYDIINDDTIDDEKIYQVVYEIEI